MEELMLLENPKRRRRRGRNPVGFDEFGNPIFIGGESMSGYNPRRKRRSRRNPVGALALPGTVREWTQGVDLMDAAAAVGGLAASTMIPGMIVKTTVTTWDKILKLAISLGAAVGAGSVARSMVSPSAGRAAIIGGIAGTAAQAITMTTGIQIGGPKALRPGRPQFRETIHVSPAAEEVQMIRP